MVRGSTARGNNYNLVRPGMVVSTDVLFFFEECLFGIT